MLAAGGYANVLQHVTTPLTLAALLLLVGIPVIRATLSKEAKANPNAAAIIRYGFILGLVFGVLAVGAYVLSQLGTREVRISGTVRDESGRPVPGATVDIAGKANGSTDGMGVFAFTVPDARAAGAYDAVVFHEQYEPEPVHMEGRQPQSVAVTLRKKQVKGNVVALAPKAVLHHYLGVPQIDAGIALNNPYPNDIKISDISLALVRPTGEVVPVAMEAFYLPLGGMGPPLNSWDLKKGESATLLYSFFNADAEFMLLRQRVATETTPQLLVQQPAAESMSLSSALVTDLRNYLDRRFIWQPGTWQMRATCRVGDQPYQGSSTFSLTADQVERMRKIGAYYPSGIGVVPTWRYLPTSDANPNAEVTLTATGEKPAP